MRPHQVSTIPDVSLAERGRLALATSPALHLPGYLDLKALAAYSSCSVRWLFLPAGSAPARSSS